jgi:hypothetical protein
MMQKIIYDGKNRQLNTEKDKQISKNSELGDVFVFQDEEVRFFYSYNDGEFRLIEGAEKAKIDFYSIVQAPGFFVNEGVSA